MNVLAMKFASSGDDAPPTRDIWLVNVSVKRVEYTTDCCSEVDVDKN